ncbi:MAG: DUF1402 family protein [Pseudobdellovibrionaceae bacterium]
MRKIAIILFQQFAMTIIFSMPSLSLAQNNQYYADSITYEELCKTDKYCGNLKNKDGNYREIKSSWKAFVPEIKDDIKEFSHKLGVDPRAVVGAMLAENTMNVQGDQTITDVYQKLKANPVSQKFSELIRGKSFSIGLGQITLKGATEVEPLLAQVERRPVRSESEINEDLLTIDGSLKYAAAAIRFCQDAFQQVGYDISKDPRTLASLYVTGDCKVKARERKERGGKPQLNYFGFFVEQNLKNLESLIEYDKPYDPKSNSRVAKQSTQNESIIQELQSRVRLSVHPATCDGKGHAEAKADDYVKTRTYSPGPVHTQAQGQFRVLSRSADCNLAEWSLIEDEKGNRGWISKEDLDKNSRKKVKSWVSGGSREYGSLCEMRDSGCVSKVKDAMGASAIGFTENGFFEIKLVGAESDREKVNVKSFDARQCLDRGMYAAKNERMASAKSAKVDGDQVDSLREKIEGKLEEIGGALKLDIQNSYLADFYSQAARLNTCKPSCTYNPEVLAEILAAKPEEFQGLKGARKLSTLFSRLSIRPSQVDPREKEKSVWQAFLNESNRSCEAVWPLAPTAKVAFNDLSEAIQRNLNSNSSPSGYNMLNEFRYNLPQVCRVLSGNETEDDLANSNPTQECRIATGSTDEMAFLSRKIVSSLKKDPEDFDAILRGVLQDLKYLAPQVALDPRSPCQYDPFESLKVVAKVLSLDCVDTVFVPDNFLIHKLPEQRGRVLHKVFLEDDRFAIRLKPVCRESKSLWERMPHTAR